MHLYCESCGAQIQAEDMNLATGLAKCRSCHAILNFAEKLGTAVPGPGDCVPRKRPPVPRPERFRLEETGNDLRVTWRWFSWGFLFLLAFCIAWDSFLVFWYVMAFGMGAPWIFKVFPVLHLAVGVGLTYFTVAGFLNRTVLELTPEVLTVWHGPVPWPGNITLPTLDMTQFYCVEDLPRARHGRPHLTFQLCALLNDGRKVKLLTGIDERDHVLFLEQTLEKWLGLKDQPVGGEMRH